MKTKSIIIAVLLTMTAFNAMSQETKQEGQIFSYKGKNKTHIIGAYAGLTVDYTQIMSRNAFWAGAKAGLVFDRRFTVGIAGSALWFDYRLDQIVDDGTYHLEAGYGGVFFEYMQPLGNNFRLGFSILLGQGTAKYVYDKDYREGKAWYLQTIDQDNFTIAEPGVEFMARVARKWWIGINGSYKYTSGLELDGTDKNILSTINGGISVRFGIF